MYKFSEILPENSPEEIWKLQQFLLQEAESLLGEIEQGKKVYQPTFSENTTSGPCIINSVNSDGAWAQLSNNSKGYWPCALYELAHETIHLLNPVCGHTNFLEEGIAVAFSVDMSSKYTQHPMSPSDKFYSRAYELVQQLPEGVYKSARKIREHCGSLGNASVDALSELFPELDAEIMQEICSDCNFT